MNRPATALYAAVAITLLIWTVIFIGMYVTMRKPAPAPATATTHEQPQIIPPHETTVSTTSTASNTNTNTQQKAVVVPPKGEKWQTRNGATTTTPLIVDVPHTAVRVPTSSTKRTRRATSAKATITSTERAASSAPPKTDPYARDFMNGKWKEDEWTTSVPATIETASAAKSSANAVRSVSPAVAIGTSSAQANAKDCATIAPDFQPQCATANSWYAQIAAHYGSAMAHHYDWLRNNAAFVADYNTNGCSPSPCDANFTGRLQPADYAGALGYDSPLGTCTSTTPTKRMRGSDGKGMLPGTLDADGSLHGAVLFNGEYYDGVITDTSCMDCTVTFTHPCQLRNWGEQPAEFIAIDGQRAYTWYLGVTQ